jgi:outer membrane protein assembly factor BamA
MRPRALVLALALSLIRLVPSVARAQTLAVPAPAGNAPGETVTVIPPTPPLEASLQAPALRPPPPPDLAGLSGRLVTRVTVVVEGSPLGERPVARPSSLAPGATLTASAARRALDSVLATGRFASASIAAEADGVGAQVVLRVVPRRIVAELRANLRGAEVDRDEVTRELDLSPGSEVAADRIPSQIERIRRYFALHGYPRAEVNITTRPAREAGQVTVTLDVVPGEPRVIGARTFNVFGARPEQVAPAEGVYGLGASSRADEPLLDRADSVLQQALRNRGYTRAEVSHDLVVVERLGKRPDVELRVRIDAGPLFVPRFEGNEHYDADVLTSVLGLETETDRSASHLVDKLRTFYQKRGFLDADVRIEARTEAAGGAPGIQLAMFHVNEGKRVRVVSRTYPCLKLDAIRSLGAGGPRSPDAIGNEIDSFLDEDLPGANFFVDPDPRGLGKTVASGASQVATAPRPVPIDLRPSETYFAETYDRAVEHVQELYRNEGFLHAEVGPVEVLRARCDPQSPPGECVPVPLPPRAGDVCAYERGGLPAAIEPLPASFTCRSDRTHGVACAPDVALVIPVRLGPRTRIWDVAFTGVKSVAERAVADAAQLSLGEAASTTKVEDARRRIADWYKELGYYYVDVKAGIEPSADNTRARIRFDVSEGDQVIVRSIRIRGLSRTKESVVRRRIALEVEKPYRTSDVRSTEQRVDTLGVFSSASVSLSDPNVPEARKDVIIDVVERDAQYIEVRPGFSTGEGVRGAFEYGHRNLLGDAWAVTLHLEASYLPNFLILDRGVAANFSRLSTLDRIATRDTLTFAWPEVGLGPAFRAELDGVFVNDLERDFTLQKGAVSGTLYWRPVRQLQVGLGPEFEHNDVFLFNGQNIATYLALPQNEGNADLAALLRVPDGASNVVAGQVTITWDRRDNALNPHRGAYLAAGVEQVNSYPVFLVSSAASPPPQYFAHFFRLTQTFRGYIPITSSVTFASELRLGEVLTTSCRLLGSGAPPNPNQPPPAPNLTPPYCTYEDRLFFMGGYDSMRGWLQDSFIPRDYVDAIAAGQLQCTNNQTNCPGVIVRGGNLMINPRFELRFPVRAPIEGAVFSDLGYLWSDPTQISKYTFLHNIAPRADVGAGVRVDTPVGPLVLDYGINVTRRSYEDFGALHFAIGLF